MDELLRRGFAPVLAGRSAERLAAVAPWHAALEQRVVGVDTPDLLREALGDVSVVVNCAGPFLDAALALAQAAVDGAHYLDVTAEQPTVQQLYRELDDAHPGAIAAAQIDGSGATQDAGLECLCIGGASWPESSHGPLAGSVKCSG